MSKILDTFDQEVSRVLSEALQVLIRRGASEPDARAILGDVHAHGQALRTVLANYVAKCEGFRTRAMVAKPEDIRAMLGERAPDRVLTNLRLTAKA